MSVADHRARARDIPAGLGLLAGIGLGLFRPRHSILGTDTAGTVESVGSGVADFAPGDRVIASRGSSFGRHAEYVCLPADGVITRAPATLTPEEAVTLVFGGITAHDFLTRVAIGPDTSVLVQAGQRRAARRSR